MYINDLNEITLIITENCNLQCSYCDQQHFKQNQDLDNIKNFFKEINLKDLNKNIQIEFFGGEPFLNLDLILETIKYIRSQLSGPQRNLITFKFNTNGTILNDKVFEIFKYIKDNDFSIPNFIISYDGLWQYLRSKKDITEIIERNINQIFQIKCLATITKISFSYQGLKNQSLIKNFLYIVNKFPISIYNIKYYLIREPWKWDNEKFKNFIENFKEFLKFDYVNFKTNKKHLLNIENKIKEFKNPKLGCGLGKTRITLKQNEILDCGLDNDFSDLKKIDFKDIEYNCLNCEIKNFCDKICPKKIFYLNKDNINYICEIKKEEFKLLKKYLRNYDKKIYKEIKWN